MRDKILFFFYDKSNCQVISVFWNLGPILFYYNDVDKNWQAAVTGEGIFLSMIKSSKLQ